MYVLLECILDRVNLINEIARGVVDNDSLADE